MLILTLFLSTLIVIICFITILYFVTNVLNTRYYITYIDKEYTLIDVNVTEKYIDYSNDTRYIEEREYLDITVTSFILFIFYLYFVSDKSKQNFFDKYFINHSDNVVY